MAILSRIGALFPTLVGAAALASCAGMLMTNIVLGVVAHDYEIHFWSYPLFGALTGVTDHLEKRRLTLRSAFDGSFQTAYANLVGPRVPIFTFAVRLRNQMEFSLLDTSTTPAVVVGAGKELVERVYIDEYCSRDVAAFVPGAQAWAARIRDMQDVVQRRKQTFLYVLTPSKIAQYPGFIPSGMPCAAPEADRAGIVPAWLSLVRAAGVAAVDTTAVITRAHGRYPFAMFPVGGTHWNAVGVALAGQAIASRLAQLRGDDIIRPLPFTWRLNDDPSGVDIVLAMLMNLIWLPDQLPVPNVEAHPPSAPAGCKPLSVVIVGGRFSHAIGETLSQQPCQTTVREYEYWHNFVLTWKDGDVAFSVLDAAQRDRDLRGADIVIYEENEQMLGHSEHGKALYDYLIDHKL